ncbi:MAG: acyl-CoA synthetase [Burkholderiales bacterium]|nr:MAG: acyl-CoA synthetase [Burkholderiales bacterium]
MPTRPNPYRQNLDRNAANYVPLTPISLVRWAADVFPDRCAAIHGSLRLTWSQMLERARRLASVLAARDVGSGDTVSVLLPNTPPMLDAHFGVPMTGAVLNTINTRLDASTVAFQLRHSGAKVFVVDREFAPLASEALALLAAGGQPRPFVVDVDDFVYRGPGERIGDVEYEAWLASGDPSHGGALPEDEWDAIGLNYTSGTTGDPKGVVVHHRGAYLNAVGNVLAWGLPRHPVYLWTLPMFHCNGWCFPWTIPAVAGTNVCLRRVEAKTILDLVREHRVTHYCGAPIVHGTLIDAPAEWKKGIDWPVRAMVAGAAPPAAMIEGMERMGWEVTHVYGLTEVYGPASVCVKHESWNELDLAGRVERNARQGVRYQVQEGLTVVDPDTMQPVPHDAETMGEVVFRGNIVMKGYLKNEKATAEAFAGGWFHTGDLGVVYPDGYVKLKDRAKDIIISGGENISSIEVEDALYKHPAVLACAVVARPDERWGETPLAFVELRAERVPGTPAESKALADELIEHCRAHLARYKVPREVRFGPVPKTSTGKIQKHVLRAQAKSASAIDR